MTSKAVSRVTAKKQALRVKANIYTYKYRYALEHVSNSPPLPF